MRLNGKEKTFKESQVAAMTGLQRGPLYEMLGRATVNKASAALLPPQAIVGVPRSRLQFSQSGVPQEDQAAVSSPPTPGQAMQALAEDETRFRRGPTSESKDLKKIVQQYSLPGELEAVTPAANFSEIPTVAVYQIDVKAGGFATIYHGRDGIVWVDTLGMRGKVKDQPAQGGDLVYQAALTYAHNNGLKFIPDPHGVKPIAKARRISQMISSAQHHKTTKHLQVAGINPRDKKSYQEVANWRDEKSEADFEHNFNQLVLAEMDYVQQEMSRHGETRLEDLRWNPQDDTVTNVVTGRRLSERDFRAIVSGLDPRNSGVGATTLSRALVARQALQSNGSGKPDLEHTESADIQPSGGTVDGSGDKLFTLLRNKKLFYSQPGSSSGPTLGTALESYEQLGQTLAETARFLNQKQPGLVNERTHLFTTVEELLASDYALQHPFTAEQIASLRSAEGFHDTETSHSFVIAENTRLLPGESPQQALTRVILHERVGHGELHILLGSAYSVRTRRWAALSAQIPPAELEAIAAETGYRHLAGRHEDLAFEWFARRTEKDLNLLEKDSLPRQMWDAFREMVMDFMARVGLRPTLGRSFETQVKDLQRRAREAALRPVMDRTNAGQSAPNSFHPQATPDRRSLSSLDDVNHLFTSLSNNPHDGSLAPHLPSLPPIWQGRARHGEDAAVLGRNPDGTFQVRLNGTEKTFKESQVAAMTGMQRGPLYAHLAQATRQQLALPHLPSLPPIWQGRARHGEDAAVLGRNPDGTFQVRIGGQVRTRTERDVAYMTGMQRGSLYEMLERATEDNQHLDLQEARWSPQPTPKGVSAQSVAEWRQHLEDKRVANPVSISELVRWQDSELDQDQSLAGEKVIERSIQSMLDLIPREVIERLGKLNLATVPMIPGAGMARYNPNTNTIEISHTEYTLWKGVDKTNVNKERVRSSMLAPLMRETMWHEMGHWLYGHASSHPRLWRWRRNLEQHWRDRTEGERVLTHKDGWKYVRDHWIKYYAGRWYPSFGWGSELPTVYLEELSKGPERIAQWCRKPHHVVTFKIVSSIFGPL